MIEEIRKELTGHIIPFWEGLKDEEYGGFYGYLDYDLHLDKKAVKGCILNSRILWFFASAYQTLGDEKLQGYADHAYDFFERYCLDRENGGILWSVAYDGRPVDTTKHTYNQAFAIYALSAYAEAKKAESECARTEHTRTESARIKHDGAEGEISETADGGETETGSGGTRAEAEHAMDQALELFGIIESRMRDEGGYLEAFTRDFRPESNEKLSENGVIADRTMNTILHVVEAYTELYRAAVLFDRQEQEQVREKLISALEIMRDKLYNPQGRYLTVFMDHDYHSLLNLDSYGHDIEAAWLIDRAAEVLGASALTESLHKMTAALTADVYEKAFDGHSIPVEIQDGKVKGDRVWWVQCEAITGFLEGYVRDGRGEYRTAAGKLWDYITEYVIDKREGSEWFWYVNPDGTPAHDPIVEPWKCPYHNGRMCLEVIRRGIDA